MRQLLDPSGHLQRAVSCFQNIPLFFFFIFTMPYHWPFNFTCPLHPLLTHVQWLYQVKSVQPMWICQSRNMMQY